METLCTRSCAVCEETQKTPWGNLPAEAIAQLDASKETHQFSRGEIIFAAGSDATHLYCVGEGRVQLFREGGGREQTFLICGPGTWIGFRDALAQMPLQHSARCLTDVTLCALPRELVQDLSASHNSFSSAVLNSLAQGWAQSEQQSYNLGVRKTRERLADYLLQLQPVVDNASAGTETAVRELPLTREILATILGTTTESVVRALSDFKARGWIATSRGSIQILQPAELERLVAESG